MLILLIGCLICCSSQNDFRITRFKRLANKFKHFLNPIKTSTTHTKINISQQAISTIKIQNIPADFTTTALILCHDEYFISINHMPSTIHSACQNERLKILYDLYQYQMSPNLTFDKFKSVVDVSYNLLHGYHLFWKKFVIFKHHKQLQKCIAMKLLQMRVNSNTNRITITDIYFDDMTSNFFYEDHQAIYQCIFLEGNYKNLMINMNGFVNYHPITQFRIYENISYLYHTSLEKIILDFSDFMYYNLIESNKKEYHYNYINIHKFVTHDIHVEAYPMTTPIDFSLFRHIDQLSISCQTNTTIKFIDFNIRNLKIMNCIIICNIRQFFFSSKHKMINITNSFVKLNKMDSGRGIFIKSMRSDYNARHFKMESEIELDCSHYIGLILNKRYNFHYSTVYLKNCYVGPILDLYTMRNTRRIALHSNKNNVTIRWDTISIFRRGYFTSSNITMDLTHTQLVCKFMRYWKSFNSHTVTIFINCCERMGGFTIQFVIDEFNELQLKLQNEYIVRYNMKEYEEFQMNGFTVLSNHININKNGKDEYELNTMCPICLQYFLDVKIYLNSSFFNICEIPI